MSLTFGLLLRRHRLAAELSQEALAERAQISPGAVSSYERGIRAVPHRATVSLLADVLGLTGVERADFVASSRRGTAASGAPASREGSNLPLELDSFVGRQDDVAAIADLLARGRTVTITGDGGVGKTRAALAVAAGFAERKRNGVWFADLGSRSDNDDVANTVAALFGLDARVEAKQMERLVAALRNREVLIVLDNCEHVIAAAARLAGALARGCAGVSVLATSRERLRVAGETVYPLDPLPLPSAVQLFIDRASVFAPEAATPQAFATVAEICRAVDGIPLAIEIVASRLTPGGLELLRTEVVQSVGIALIGNRDLPDRQQTMLATLDWGFRTLREPEQVLYERIGIFAGGFTLEAAQSVCAGDPLSESAVRDGLSALLEKSFVRCDLLLDVPRYAMLQIHRAFAKSKAAAAGEDAAIADRHAAWILATSRHAATLLSRVNRLDWHNAFDAELENIRAALRRLMRSPGGKGHALEIVGGLCDVWYENGRSSELRTYFDTLVPDAGAMEPSWALVTVLQFRSRIVPPAEGVALARRAIEIDRVLGGGRAGMLLSNLASRYRLAGDLDAAARVLDDAFAGLDGSGVHTRLAMHTYVERARLARARGRLDDARSDLVLALEMCRAIGEAFYLSHIGHYLADIEFEAGNVAAAIAAAEIAMDDARRADSRRDEMYLACNLASYRIAASDLAGAHAAATATIALARGTEPLILAIGLQHLATVGALSGDFARAARLAGFVDARLNELGVQREETERVPHAAMMRALETGIPNETVRLAHLARGANDSEDDALLQAGLIVRPA